MLANHRKQPRRGLILLVVLALITLFASVGVAFVYYAEQEASKASDQKASETVKLPDADILFSYVMKQIVFPTNNNASALYTQSLLENMYGQSGVVPFSGTGPRPRLYRDNRAGVIDGQLVAGYTTNPLLIGQDELFRINRQFRTYDEGLMGSLNPTYTYPDHKNPFLAGVSANWTDMNGTQQGPVAIARSFAREMKFRVAVLDPAAPLGNPNVVGYRDIIVNPYTGTDYNFWSTSTLMTNVATQERFYVKALPAAGAPGGLPLVAPFQYAATAGAPVLALGQPVIQCDANGNNAFIVLHSSAVRAHTLRPEPRNHPNFSPPGDLGGDVKNLPPEVKTLVGYNGTTPVFANNDSYWMDIGFPALPWSNNRRIKPLAAVFIMDNDGKVNMNTAGNLRGFDNINGSYHVSSHGLGPWEVSPRKLYPSTGNPALAAQMDQEVRQLFGGAQLSQNRFLRGRDGIDPNTGIAVDPSTINTNYWPLLRNAPFYSMYNADGTYDNASPPVPNYSFSPAYTLPGQSLAYGRFPANNGAALGYGNASLNEWTRNGALRSPLFSSPFAFSQPTSNIYSNNAGSTQRSFALQNMEAMYRALDSGSDKIDSDLRRLMPIAFTFPLTRWQMTGASMDLNVAAVAPWFSSNTGNATMPRNPPSPQAILDSNYARPAGPPAQLPWATPSSPTATAQGEFVGQLPATPLWRSIFGNNDRIDLAKQLPDYPLPVNALGNVDPNAQLNLANPVVKAQYMVALHARQKLADQIFWRLVYLTHPDITAGPTTMNSPRWLAQLAVNIVDYIDNDDYPTWYQVPRLIIDPATGALVPKAIVASADNIVWGTELPRLVINEVYCEAVNPNSGGTTTSPGGNTVASADYEVRHWVELYNPLNNPAAPFIGWPDGANARLTVNGSSVYRLVITPQLNANDPANPATGIRGDSKNTMGYPISTADTKTNVVLFNGTTAANSVIPPSDANFGPIVPPTTPNGFYLVAPTDPPVNTDPLSSFPTMTTNPNNMYQSPQMAVQTRIDHNQTPPGPFTDTPNNRQVILLQRLANPYLQHNPMPGVNVTFPTDTPHDPALPYNPYITIDYVENISPNHAINHTNQDTPTNTDVTPVEDRAAIGKLQPYSGLNERPAASPAKLLWVKQTPDRDLNTAGINKLQNQVQHTFFRHNSIEATTPQYGQRPGGATVSAYANTLQLPFDWLVHLDRAPVSPAELLQVSGYRPHELTQTFHNAVTLTATLPTAPSTTLVTGNTFRFTGTFIGALQGIPYTLKLNDLVKVTYTVTASGTQVDEWVRVNQIDPNYGWFEGEVSNANVVNQNVNVQLVIPYAHTAPWYRVPTNAAGETTDVQSSNRLYRLLECVAVRNPGVDVGQVRFTSNTNAIGAVLADGSRWITLDNTAGISGMPVITTNDALLALQTGTPVPMQVPLLPANTNIPSYAPFFPGSANYPSGVGDNVVFFAGTANEYRSLVLEANWQTNSIRVVLPNSALPPAGAFAIDYAYHSGRQPGKINLNTVWDLETFLALADVKPMNAFWHDPKAIAPNTPPPIIDREALAKLAFQRLYAQRQFGYFDIPRMPGQTGVNNVGEDRPLQGMGTGDITPGVTPPGYVSPPDVEIPRQDIGNTLLSRRYREGGYAPYEANGPKAGLTPIYSTPERDLASLFEFYLPQPPVPAGAAVPTYLPDPGMNHPYRRFELLSKIWNNSSVRSNTFSVWITIGFFEYDEATGLGAELGQINGKNTRYRFFSVVDRTSVDSWLKSWQLYDGTATINLFANTTIFPTLDPRDLTYANIFNPDLTTPAATRTPTNYPVKEVICSPPQSIAGAGNVCFMDCVNEYLTYGPLNSNPLWNMFGRKVQVTSLDSAGNVLQQETTSILNPTTPTTTYDPNYVYPPQYGLPSLVPKARIFARLSPQPAGTVLVIVRPLPVPPTVLHWSQLK